MRLFPVVCLAVSAVSALAAQTPAPSNSELPKDPRAMLSAVLPSYDFKSMKPWHLKGTYQLYDESGRPTKQGTYEYWHESPAVYRSSWTRADATRTEWHTADGKSVYKATGDRLFYFEHNLEKFLFSPVPDPAKLDLAAVDLKKDQFAVGKLKLPCAEIAARTRSDHTTPELPGVSGRFCFDTSLPMLRVVELFHSAYVEFNKLGKIQDRVLAREITVTDRRHYLLTFKLDATQALPNDTTELVPPSDSLPYSSESGSSSGIGGHLIKKVPPSYPPGAKEERISGAVMLDTLVDKDGHVKEMRVLDTASPLLTAASKDAVAQWQYDPFIVNGQPQEVNTIINVTYSLSY